MAEKKPNSDHEFLILKKVKGVNTQPSREAIGPDEYSWLENMMPIGDAFIKAVPAQATATATITASMQSMHSATLGTVDYQICFTTSGGAQAVNLGSGSVVQIFASGTFSGQPSMDQWKSERIVIADTNGMFSWDGSLSYSPGSLATITVVAAGNGYTATPVVTVTGGTTATTASAQAILSSGGVSEVRLVTTGSGYTAAPAIGFTGGTAGTAATASAYIMPTGMGGDAIAVYSGRTWVGNGRVLSFTAPNTWYDVSTSAAAGSTTITEGSLRRRIYALEALDNYLYIFGDASIIIVGDLKVTGSVTTFSQTFLSSTTGTTLPRTITAMERAIIFANHEGVWGMFGASLQKISNALDGIFPDIDFSNASGGLAAIYNILCYVFSFQYTGDGTSRQIQALFFNGKWFFTSQGDGIVTVSPIQRSGVHELWASSGQDVRLLYADSDAQIAQTLQTGLYDLGNPVFDKLVIFAGIEYTAPAAASLMFQVDTESQTTSTQSASGSTLTWYNNSGVEIDWRNNANNEIVWVATAFLLDYFAAAISGKYIGATVTSTSPQLEVNGILMEYKRQAAWGR